MENGVYLLGKLGNSLRGRKDKAMAIRIKNKTAYITAQDAFSDLYMPTGEVKLQNGYVSRRSDPLTSRVYIAGGNRQGQLFYLEPNYNSTRYCYRVYLRKVGE